MAGSSRGADLERTRLLGGAGDSDDELIGAASGSRQTGVREPQNDKISNVQQQVQGVMGVMQQNINKILERGERLDDLESQADNLNVNADQFRRGATQVRRRMWWQNCRMKIIIGLVILAVIAIIVAVAVTQTEKNKQA